MSSPTDPREFLHELGGIERFIADLLDCPRKPAWHWPSFYLLYVEVDRLSMLLMRLDWLFNSPAGKGDFAHELQDRLREVGRRQKTIVGSLWQLYRATQPAAEQQGRHDRVGAHVHPKSGWYQAFMHQYGHDEVSMESMALVRTALPVDSHLSPERIDQASAECMLRRQRFDIGSPQACLLLATAVRQAGDELGTVLGLMSRYLHAHCRIDDLLHPCSH